MDDPGPIQLGPPSEFPGNPIAQSNTGVWDAVEIREPGGVVFDTISNQYVAVWSGLAADGTTKVGLAVSSNGVTGWTPDAGNPITGATEAEDPYIAKNVDGTVYRDGSNRALMFTEEKSSGTHRGVELWRSTAGTLTGWTLFGRVLDRGGPGTWNERDSTSPVVINDGTQLVMLFEGREPFPGQLGQIGYAVSADEGETWTPDVSPIIVQGSAGTWNDTAVVCDDLIKVGNKWVLLGHGDSGGGTWQVGRWSTTDSPADWDNTSFTEMAGNPYSTVEFVTVWGNNAARAARNVPTSFDVVRVYEDT